MRGKAHGDEVRAAVMAALLAGQGVNEIAREFKLNEATVRNWKRQLSDEQLTEINEKKSNDDFGDLLATYLRETLTTLTVQAIHFRDLDWLRKQPASELAILHGVQTDKAIRLLEAAERATAADPDPSET